MTLTLGHGQTPNVAQYILHHMTYAPAKFVATMSNGLGGNAFTIPTEVKVTWSIALYIMWPMTYAPAKFRAAMPNGLGGNAFTIPIKVKVTWSIALYIM